MSYQYCYGIPRDVGREASNAWAVGRRLPSPQAACSFEPRPDIFLLIMYATGDPDTLLMTNLCLYRNPSIINIPKVSLPHLLLYKHSKTLLYYNIYLIFMSEAEFKY